jgi:hypothetical protein
MKTCPYRLLAFSILLFWGSGILAQSNGAGDWRSMKIDRVNVFSDQHAPEVSAADSDPVVSSASWAIKANPIVLFRGEVPVYIERRLNRNFSMEAALGVTFEDFFKESVLQGKSIFQKDPNVDKLSGVTSKLALRYYPRHNALSDLYISPEIDFKNYRKDVSGVYMGADGRYTSGKLRDKQAYADFKAIVGFQNTDEFNSDFYTDWYLGVGLRLGAEDNVVTDELNATVIKVKHADILSPVITVGVKIGLGF